MSTSARSIQRALAAVHDDPELRPDAVRALVGSALYAAHDPGEPRRVFTAPSASTGVALALFTDARELTRAALVFGWPVAVLPRPLHISEAMRLARAHELGAALVDPGGEHAFELDLGEMELVSAPASSRPAPAAEGPSRWSASEPPPAGSEVRRVTTHPPPPMSPAAPPRTLASALEPSTMQVDVERHTASATFAMPASATMAELAVAPSEELADALHRVLTAHPEVEWACFIGESARSDDTPSVALRVDPAFRAKLPAIASELRRVSAAHGGSPDVFALESPEQVRCAHQLGVPFYPWRRR